MRVRYIVVLPPSRFSIRNEGPVTVLDDVDFAALHGFVERRAPYAMSFTEVVHTPVDP